MNIILNPARRRAERFAELLDEPGSAGTDGPFAGDLATVASMRALVETAPAPRADFVADLRTRLMAEADTALVPTDRRLLLPDRTGTGRRPGRAAAVIAAAALVAGSAGMAVAAQNSLPGQSLYSLKRGIENTHEALSFSNAAQGRALLGQASARLGEAKSLSKRGNSTEASATLDQFVASAG
ncbi:MAG: hypothetical protein JWO46_1502, partial [Nocardioidaceae bacterium]|nr:hypothetical protein [Nocardioidaceae bacterium]